MHIGYNTVVALLIFTRRPRCENVYRCQIQMAHQIHKQQDANVATTGKPFDHIVKPCPVFGGGI